ncbi:MAG: bifunctional glutamate N-acetyltransferase/amino-acid acetyltransferase ArgJ [Treponema sp.]|nr:bifunctional glutamate N-acetyltransferase/amino-acid acetyltransferase ArgJ [Treponema sp.]
MTRQSREGGVTAPCGFTAHGVLCGIKADCTTPDLALIFSERPCAAAGVFTKNRVQAECVRLTRAHLADGRAQAVIVNSGNANACTGPTGASHAERMAACTAAALDIAPEDVAVCSTGVIGVPLPIEKIEGAVGVLAAGLSKEGHAAARQAILTTDTRYKEAATQCVIDGKTVTIGAMCKGSGMIHINLGTMLAFVTTDCAISAEMLSRALSDSVEHTFNCVSVDGDTSTNDTLVILANGMAGNREITQEDESYRTFVAALDDVQTVLAKKIAADGEGATKLIECIVTGASDDATARVLAKAVISSNLVKAALFGQDANWGRILCALGYSGASFTPERCSILFARADDRAYSSGADSAAPEQAEHVQPVVVFENGVPQQFDERAVLHILGSAAVQIQVMLADGNGSGCAWGCDLTYDYVKINGAYRT